jgi:hypothetical protein
MYFLKALFATFRLTCLDVKLQQRQVYRWPQYRHDIQHSQELLSSYFVKRSPYYIKLKYKLYIIIKCIANATFSYQYLYNKTLGKFW